MKWLLFNLFFLPQNMPAQKGDTIPIKNMSPIPCLSKCFHADKTKIKGAVICCADLAPNITIQQIQMGLNQHGYKLQVDGIFGGKTKKALISFQQKSGLSTDSDVSLFELLGIITPLQ